MGPAKVEYRLRFSKMQLIVVEYRLFLSCVCLGDSVGLIFCTDKAPVIFKNSSFWSM